MIYILNIYFMLKFNLIFILYNNYQTKTKILVYEILLNKIYKK